MGVLLGEGPDSLAENRLSPKGSLLGRDSPEGLPRGVEVFRGDAILASNLLPLVDELPSGLLGVLVPPGLLRDQFGVFRGCGVEAPRSDFEPLLDFRSPLREFLGDALRDGFELKADA